jgi:protein tyrosine/serine phosphatase
MKRITRDFAIAVLLGSCSAVDLGALQMTGNFHTVVAAEFYRSGQLTPAQIAKYAKEYGIKTIINLCGDNAGRSWYDAEVGEASRLGINHIDFGMSARRELTASQADALIVLMKGTQKPILIHCKEGIVKLNSILPVRVSERG